MAINTTRLATRLGSAVKVLNEANTTNQANQATTVSALQSYAQAALIQEVLADRPQTDQNLDACFVEWTRQMALVPDTFSAATCTTTLAAIGSPTGTAKHVTSDLDAYGSRSDFLVPDVIVVRATGADTVTLMGKAATANKTDPTWPTGAGVSTSATLVDPDTTSDAADPGFEAWTTTLPYTPTSWSIAAGTAGTTVTRTSDGFIDATGYALAFVGDTTQLRVRQDVSALATGTYAIHVALKKTVGAVGTGTVSVTLRDASGNVISATGVSQTVAGLTLNTWTPLTAAVYIPRQLTNGCYLEIRVTLGTADTVLVDCLSLRAMTTLYTAGLKYLGFSGITGMVLDADQWTLTTALDSGSITTRLAKGIDRLFNVSTLSARLPSGGSPTQADALIA